MFESKRNVDNLSNVVRLVGKTLTFWGDIISEIGKESVDENNGQGNDVTAQHGPSFSLVTINLAPNVAPSLVLSEQAGDEAVDEMHEPNLSELIDTAVFAIPIRMIDISKKGVDKLMNGEQ